ncbi:DNA-processing protein DprA [bacterium]|nr:DNA-processing protein DprA [bacterium]
MSSPGEVIALLNLLAVDGIGPGTTIRLIRECGSAESVFDASDSKLRTIHGITDRLIAPLRKVSAVAEAGQRQWEAAQEAGVEIRTYWDDNYPQLLRELETDAPALLFIRGEFQSDATRVAVVGTRRATAYGKRAADELIGGLRGTGIHVVSGLASGVDSFAHEAALHAELVTEAVFGCGVDRIYPAGNEKLAQRILDAGGALLSEYPIGTIHTKYTFPQRNRIIAGLSKAVIVVEAPARSGAQITAGLSIEYGRDVGAVPGPVYSVMSKGTHELIKSGAALIESPEDVLALIRTMSPVAEEKASIIELPFDLPQEERQIIESLDATESIHIDTLAEKMELSTGEVLSRLLMLELKGLIKQLPGKYFIRA